jgi:hypothetical protein
MQRRPANCEPVMAGRKNRLCGQAGTEKANTPHRTRVRSGQHNSKLLKRRNRVRHQRFAAGFIDRRSRSVGHDHAESLLPGGDCCGQSCRAPTDDKYVR